MVVKFYDYTDNPIVIHKKIDHDDDTVAQPLKTLETVIPYEPLSDLEGYLILEYDNLVERANYCYFEERYYFIKDREKLIGGKLRLTLRVDVLKTYENQIDHIDVVCKRTALASLQSQYMADPYAPVETRRYESQQEGKLAENTTVAYIAGLSPDILLVTVG